MYTDKQIREIFHFLFLERFLRSVDGRMFAIKGGVNLRFFYDSPRYSEDIDLDIFVGSVTTLKKNVYKILDDPSFLRILKTFGIEKILINDPLKAKHTETTQRFKVRLESSSGDLFSTKVEFSRRKKLSPEVIKSKISELITQKYHRPTLLCPHYSADAAVIQKIEALAGRDQPQSRDAFDLYLLINSHQINFSSLTSKTKRISQIASENLIAMDFQNYQGQVVEYLEDDYRAQYGTKEFWQLIQGELIKLFSTEPFSNGK